MITCLLIFKIVVFTDAQVPNSIKEIIEAPESQGSIIGISVLDEIGDQLLEINSSSRLIPASTLKLITTISTLDILGADYRYQTLVGYSGEILDGGTLDGNLIVKGSGDPSFASPEFEEVSSLEEILSQIVEWVTKNGIRCIDGKILVDASYFDQAPIHGSWAWDDLTNYYTSGAWGLNVHENLYYIYFSRSVDEDDATGIEQVTPYVPGLSLRNMVKTGPKNSGDNAYIFGSPYDNERWIEGTIPPGDGTFRIKGALPNPMKFFGFHLSEELENEGIISNGLAIEPGPKEFVELGRFTSPRLLALVDHANAISNNLYCEAFYRTMGAHAFGQGNFETGKKSILDQLTSSGLQVDQIVLNDGSGLSSRNRLTPEFLSRFINHYTSRMGLDRIKQILPTVGEEGSVRNFLRNYPSQNNAWLKSGSINNVLAYAGILRSKSGQHLSIAVMANGHNSNRRLRSQLEKIIDHIYEHY